MEDRKGDACDFFKHQLKYRVCCRQKTHDYVVIVNQKNERPELESTNLGLSSKDAAPDPCLVNKIPPIPTTHIHAEVDELAFFSGSRANRTMYGFKRGFASPYKNEF